MSQKYHLPCPRVAELSNLALRSSRDVYLKEFGKSLFSNCPLDSQTSKWFSQKPRGGSSQAKRAETRAVKEAGSEDIDYVDDFYTFDR